MQRVSSFSPLAVAGALMLAAPLSWATDGYFSHGYGTKAKSMGGAAVALAQDGFAGANNPAAAAFAGNRWEVGADLFMPDRSASRSVSGVTVQSADSGREQFLIPEFGYNRQLTEQVGFAFTVYGNGGMNTSYDTNLLGGSGTLGVDLSQLILAPSLAYKLTPDHAIGVAPLLVYQRFAAEGLQAFAQTPGMSSSPADVTNKGHDSSAGIGVRFGYQGKLNDAWRIGASYSPKVHMGRLKDYQGLFAGAGGFDIPENYVVGAAWQANSSVQLALDYQRINYNGLASIGNPSTAAAQLGSANGPGFGWQDINVWKLGVQWQASPEWTLRAGYNHSQNPITSRDVTFNILAPGVITDHLTLGATLQLDPQSELSLSYVYAFNNNVKGVSLFDSVNFGGPGNGSVQETLRMHQNTIGVQYGRRF